MPQCSCTHRYRPPGPAGARPYDAVAHNPDMASVKLPLSGAVEELLNRKAAEELSASHTYLAASFWFKNRDFDGISSYLLKEAE